MTQPGSGENRGHGNQVILSQDIIDLAGANGGATILSPLPLKTMLRSALWRPYLFLSIPACSRVLSYCLRRRLLEGRDTPQPQPAVSILCPYRAANCRGFMGDLSEKKVCVGGLVGVYATDGLCLRDPPDRPCKLRVMSVISSQFTTPAIQRHRLSLRLMVRSGSRPTSIGPTE